MTGINLLFFIIPAPIILAKRHNNKFTNEFTPNPLKKKMSCNTPLTTPIKTAFSFLLISENAIAKVNNKLG